LIVRLPSFDFRLSFHYEGWEISGTSIYRKEKRQKKKKESSEKCRMLKDPFPTCMRVCVYLPSFLPSCSITLHRVATTGIMPGMGAYAFEPRTERIRNPKGLAPILFQLAIHGFTNQSTKRLQLAERTGDVNVYDTEERPYNGRYICFIPFQITECAEPYVPLTAPPGPPFLLYGGGWWGGNLFFPSLWQSLTVDKQNKGTLNCH